MQFVYASNLHNRPPHLPLTCLVIHFPTTLKLLTSCSTLHLRNYFCQLLSLWLVNLVLFTFILAVAPGIGTSHEFPSVTFQSQLSIKNTFTLAASCSYDILISLSSLEAFVGLSVNTCCCHKHLSHTT